MSAILKVHPINYPNLVYVLGCLTLVGCLSTTTPNRPNVVQQIQNQEMKDKLNEHVEEFKTIKPAIERLIAMESDFKVMVSQIAKINQSNGEQSTEQLISQDFDYAKESPPAVLDPHNTQPEVEVLYVSDTAPEPEAIIALSSAPLLPEVDSGTTATIPEQFMDMDTEELVTITAKSSVRLFPPSRFPSCVPLDVTSDARKYGIHVASFNSLESLPRGWDESVQRFPDFCQKGAVIEKVIVKNQQYYSLRVGPYVSRSEAKSICYSLKKQKQYCRVTAFTGERL